MENRIIEDIDKVEKVKSSSSDGVINFDQFLIQVCIMLMGLIIKDTSRIMFQNQQNNVDNDNNIIDNAPIQEIVNKSNISLRRFTKQRIFSLGILLMSMRYSLSEENMNVMRRQ